MSQIYSNILLIFRILECKKDFQYRKEKLMTDPTHLGTFLFFTVISKVSITTVLNIHIIRNVQGQSIINMLQRKTVMWRVPEIISFVLNTWHLKVSGLKKKKVKTVPRVIKCLYKKLASSLNIPFLPQRQTLVSFQKFHANQSRDSFQNHLSKHKQEHFTHTVFYLKFSERFQIFPTVYQILPNSF